jgi:pilus assembly protein Flp/PilA
MRKMLRLGQATLRDDRGATAIEYALIAGLIAAGLIVTVGILGDSVAGSFASVNTEFEAYR